MHYIVGLARQGNNPRYVVTNLTGSLQALYDGLYCQRGEVKWTPEMRQ